MPALASINTDKPNYKIGEMVQFKISNTSDEVINFINAGFGFEINLQDSIVWSLGGADVLTPLEPGQSRTVEWNQHNQDDEQVSAGKYLASVKYYASQATDLLNSTKEFEIIDY